MCIWSTICVGYTILSFLLHTYIDTLLVRNQGLGCEMDEERCKALVSVYDLDRSGVLETEEFVMWMMLEHVRVSEQVDRSRARQEGVCVVFYFAKQKHTRGAIYLDYLFLHTLRVLPRTGPAVSSFPYKLHHSALFSRVFFS